MPDVMFTGPEGRLEGRYHQSKEERAPIALILHPHPQYGGTMNHKVVSTPCSIRVRESQGFSVLRFNFTRGVGRSRRARFDNGAMGELSDAAAALDWLQGMNADAKSCWIAGYSFGAWIGMQLLMRRPEIDCFVSVAPPANSYDFAFLAPCPSSGLIVGAEKDEVVPQADIQKLVARLSLQKGITVESRTIKGANHFFHDSLDKLAVDVDKYVAKSLLNPPGRATSNKEP
jgi:alpha/beta superfamily hydrolase